MHVNRIFLDAAGLVFLCSSGTCLADEAAVPCAGKFFINSNHLEGSLIIQADPDNPYPGRFTGFMSFSGIRTPVNGRCDKNQIHFKRKLKDGEEQVYTGSYSTTKNLLLEGTFTQGDASQHFQWRAF